MKNGAITDPADFQRIIERAGDMLGTLPAHQPENDLNATPARIMFELKNTQTLLAQIKQALLAGFR